MWEASTLLDYVKEILACTAAAKEYDDDQYNK